MFISVIAFRNNVRFLPVTATHIFMYLNLDNHSITTATLYIITHTRPHQEKYQDVDGKYKESMVANAQLYNEKTALIYQVEGLKDRCVCGWGGGGYVCVWIKRIQYSVV